MLPLRYIFVLAASCLLVIAGLAGSKYLHHSFIERFRQDLRAAAAAGKLPKELDGVDLDTVTLEGLEIRAIGQSSSLKACSTPSRF